MTKPSLYRIAASLLLCAAITTAAPAQVTFTTLVNFNGTDGAYPDAALVQGANGDFYGTTVGGGTNGKGAVFKVASTGKLTTLYSFCSQANCADGNVPFAALFQAANGNFYGTTYGGGPNEGTVFKITSEGSLTTLHIFLGIDGAYPRAGLIQATDGDFYGTTFNGGENGEGTVFKITPAGILTKLHTFDGADGSSPYAGLIQATSGDLYGTTASGGANDADQGTVFRLSVGLGPFVATRPTSGDEGASVIILGTNLTGSTSVTFNGTPATFNVISASEITTTVPAGATTGTVEVTTSSRTLKSNVPFRVLP